MAKAKKRAVTLPGELFPRGTPVWVSDREGLRPDQPGIYAGKIVRFGQMHRVEAKKGSRAGWDCDEGQIRRQEGQ